MIVTRAPLRLSLAGGGTDLPWFTAAGEPADIVATAIDRFVYVAIGPRFDGGIRAAYSKVEDVERPEDLEHPILREALSRYRTRSLEIHTMADIPAGTGLGSSGAFTVALLLALKAWERRAAEVAVWGDLGQEAFELEQLVDPNTGWQDHAIAALGGTLRLRREPGARAPLMVTRAHVPGLSRLSLWYTGRKRKAAAILEEQATARRVDAMREIRALVPVALEAGIGAAFARHWELKKTTASSMTDPELDEHVTAAYRAGADGVKVVGAGGGGFLLVSALDKRYLEVENALEARGLRWTNVTPGARGAEIVSWGRS